MAIVAADVECMPLLELLIKEGPVLDLADLARFYISKSKRLTV